MRGDQAWYFMTGVHCGYSRVKLCTQFCVYTTYILHLPLLVPTTHYLSFSFVFPPVSCLILSLFPSIDVFPLISRLALLVCCLFLFLFEWCGLFGWPCFFHCLGFCCGILQVQKSFNPSEKGGLVPVEPVSK